MAHFRAASIIISDKNWPLNIFLPLAQLNKWLARFRRSPYGWALPTVEDTRGSCCFSHHVSLPVLPVDIWSMINNSYLIRYCVVKMACGSCSCGKGGSQMILLLDELSLLQWINRQGTPNAVNVIWNVNGEPFSLLNQLDCGWLMSAVNHHCCWAALFWIVDDVTEFKLCFASSSLNFKCI